MGLFTETEAKGFGNFLDNFAGASDQELARNPSLAGGVGGLRLGAESGWSNISPDYTVTNGHGSHHRPNGGSIHEMDALDSRRGSFQPHQHQQHSQPLQPYQPGSSASVSNSANPPSVHQAFASPSFHHHAATQNPGQMNSTYQNGSYHFSPLAPYSTSGAYQPSPSSVVHHQNSIHHGQSLGIGGIPRPGEQSNNHGFPHHHLQLAPFASSVSNLPHPSQQQTQKAVDDAEHTRVEKMAQQARDLSLWMKSRGIGSSDDSATRTGKQGSSQTQKTAPMRDQQIGLDLESPHADIGKNSSLNRKRANEKADEARREEESILLMKQAESKSAALSKRVIAPRKNAAVKGSNMRGRLCDANLDVALSRDGVDPSKMNSRSTASPSRALPKKRRAGSPKATQADAGKGKHVKAEDGGSDQQAGYYIEERDTIFSDSNPNPPPETTPRNIPSCPYPPAPNRQLNASRPSLNGSVDNLTVNAPGPTPSPLPQPGSKGDVDMTDSAEVGSDSTGGVGIKPALLSEAQKKANHIASEQKRRAAIRAGYEGLCSIVPALKAAVEEFEERVKKVKSLNSGSKKKNGGAGLMGGIQIGGEKVDGRAGPKSEAVVLGKTVDRVRVLLRTRQELMGQLSKAYEVGCRHGIEIPGGYRNWEDKWDDSFASHGIITKAGGTSVDAAKEADEWEEEEEEEDG